MKKNRLLSVMIMAAWLAGAPLWGQQPGGEPLYPPPAPIGPQITAPATPYDEPHTPGVLSDWIADERPANNVESRWYSPLYTEWYLSSGLSLPVSRATSPLARELETGWSLQGGARLLLFNEAMTQAWYLDLHIINTNESAGHNNQGYDLILYQNATKFTFSKTSAQGQATLEDSNRTMVGLGLGHQWYVWKSADCPDRFWRFGLDFGARYGSHRVDLDAFGHITDTCSGIYAGAYTDLEWKCKNVVIFAGARIEWAYTASDILQSVNSDLQDLNFMFTLGFRY